MTYPYHTAYIGMGSNLADPIGQLKDAIHALTTLHGCELIACSSLYASKPMGPQDQPDYVNAVACLKTELKPLTLLKELQQIEQIQGRQRNGQRWGPRTLDLDILLIDQEQINTPELQVPHYGMQSREFVLYPLQEIAPDLQLPCGKLLSELVANCPANGLTAIVAADQVWQPAR